jgi:hypothetical protein
MKPCPWCNEDDAELDMVTIPTSTEPGYAIACANCGCVGPMGADEKQAIEKWEARGT